MVMVVAQGPPGTQMQVQMPDGQLMTVVVPQGVGPGQQFGVQQPMMMGAAQPIMMQGQQPMMMRGQQPMMVAEPMMMMGGQQMMMPLMGQASMTGAAGLAQVIAPYSYLKIVQDPSLIEGLSQGCCETTNSYRIFGGTSEEDSTAPLAIARESGPAWARCCCAPHNSMLLHVNDAHNESNTFVTLERPGVNCCDGEGGGFGPKPCMCCFVCDESCADGMTMHDGRVDGHAGSIAKDRALMTLKQPASGGGGCTPTIEVHGANATESHFKGVVEGPCVFGGCSENCCDANFRYSAQAGGSGDIGTITHLRPKSCTQLTTESCTDADRFGIQISDSKTGEEKLDVLMAALLTDYMFFEQDNGMCAVKQRPGKNPECKITCCMCFCYGCLCPCNCSCGGGARDGNYGAPPTAENTDGQTVNKKSDSNLVLRLQGRRASVPASHAGLAPAADAMRRDQ